jgi:hypothetical protein
MFLAAIDPRIITDVGIVLIVAMGILATAIVAVGILYVIALLIAMFFRIFGGN